MMDCEHDTILKSTKQIKKLGSCKFQYRASTCQNCNAVLWTNALDKKYKAWQLENKDKFVLQFNVTSKTHAGIQNILQRYPGTADSHFVRAVLSVFVNYVFANPIVSRGIDTLRSTAGYKALVADTQRNKMKARINPNLLESVETWAALVDMPTSKFVEECLTQIVVLFLERGKSATWTDDLSKQLDTVMKAA